MRKMDQLAALAPTEKREALKQLILSLTDKQADWLIEVVKCSFAKHLSEQRG